MTKFRKKPVVVEAVQFPGCDIINNYSSGGIVDLEKFDNFVAFDSWSLSVGAGAYLRYVGNTVQISTLEGVMTANPGDWIIKGVNGEFYPCKDDIFQKTYERDSD